MSSELLLDAAGRRRSPAAMPGHNAGHAPRNKGRVYPADPPTVDEIVAVMRQTPADRHGLRLRALIVVLWRGGLRIQEVLSLIESDLDPRRGSILIRGGKGQSPPGGRDGRLGVERSSRSVARRQGRAAGRCAVLRDRRTDAWAAVVSDRRAR
jgi:integrase